MTFKIQNGRDIWSFEAAGLHYYVRQVREGVIMTQCDYTQAEAKALWAQLLQVGARPL